jgi:arsenate reductase
MNIFVYLKCSTCQKALRFLKDKTIDVSICEINLTPPSREELEKMLEYQKGDLKKIINTSGLLYREMKLSEKFNEMSKDDILSLLCTQGMLVKRPFLLGDHFGLVGFKEVEWSSRIIQSSHF